MAWHCNLCNVDVQGIKCPKCNKFQVQSDQEWKNQQKQSQLSQPKEEVKKPMPGSSLKPTVVYTLFRGDDREPTNIKTAGGFSAWVELNADTARALVERCTGMNVQVTLPEVNEDFQTKIMSTTCKPADLTARIKWTKDRTTMQVSTALDENCGGQASGKYIYKMEFENLNYFNCRDSSPWKLVKKPTTLKWDSMQSILIVVDKEKWSDATIIAVSCMDEVFFLTKIPYDAIKKYKKPNGGTWYDMPT